MGTKSDVEHQLCCLRNQVWSEHWMFSNWALPSLFLLKLQKTTQHNTRSKDRGEVSILSLSLAGCSWVRPLTTSPSSPLGKVALYLQTRLDYRIMGVPSRSEAAVNIDEAGGFLHETTTLWGAAWGPLDQKHHLTPSLPWCMTFPPQTLCFYEGLYQTTSNYWHAAAFIQSQQCPLYT